MADPGGPEGVLCSLLILKKISFIRFFAQSKLTSMDGNEVMVWRTTRSTRNSITSIKSRVFFVFLPFLQ